MTCAAVAARPALEVADVVRAHGAAYLEAHGAQLSDAQRRALHELARCRTAALGGHTEQCAGCGEQVIAYNSCRNRHCPKCQAAARADWWARESGLLLPVEYHHVVFTLPQALGPLALQNPRVLYVSEDTSEWRLGDTKCYEPRPDDSCRPRAVGIAPWPAFAAGQGGRCRWPPSLLRRRL